MTEFHSLLKSLSAQGGESLKGIRRGLEKETLRITPTGGLSQTPHPSSLGSALTHPHITTDFSEALLEFITPPCSSINDMLNWLDEIHCFSVSKLHTQNELLWLSSMPCVIKDDDSIPIAQYGSSNIAQMKHIYRVGLSHRYGRSMQTIAGIHYNFSFPDEFWQVLQHIENRHDPLQDYKTEKYFALIRNYRRYFWLLIYLFGSAPALCPTFVKNRQHSLQKLQEKTLYLPYATSLRMGNLGYQSNAQEDLIVDYNSLEGYTKSLLTGLTTSHPDYEKIGTNVDGEYRQLNTHLLQIENEFYSAIRPKRTVDYGEAPIRALKARGVEYIEVRSIDVNPFDPLGIDTTQSHFIEAFLLFCLLEPSPPTDAEEYRQITENQRRVVNEGREPALKIYCHRQEITLRDCGKQLLNSVSQCANLLGRATGDEAYPSSIAPQYEKLSDAQKTPSAYMLETMRSEGLSFYELALQQSQKHCDTFLSRPLNLDRQDYFESLHTLSLADQLALEQGDRVSFGEYLQKYFRQYQDL